jgi:cytochrome oxidase assembly protein ShyY1
VGSETWQRLDLAAIRRRVPYPIAPYYLIVEADSTHPAEHTVRGRTLPIRIAPPALDNGPHLSYAIQWALIAVAVLGFGIFFVRGER